MTHFVTDWKDDIRDIIIRVRAEIIQLVNEVTDKFIN